MVDITRGNVPAAGRANTVGTLTVVQSVADLASAVQAGTMTAAQARLIFAQRCAAELGRAIEGASRTDAELDAQIAEYAAAVAAVKAARPAGTL